MTKQLTRDTNAAIGFLELAGPIDDVIANLQDLKARGILEIKCDNHAYEGYVDWYAMRLETDEEEASRLRHQELLRLREQEHLAQKEAKERRQLARLIAKYGVETPDGA